jgi:peptidyl-prolyl cis-trans isomerase C
MIKVRASQIFTHSMEDVVAAKKLLDAGTSFEETVEKYSTCPSKKNAGDLGWMPEGNLQSIMGQEISKDQLGEIIGPVHSQYGYHILRISEIEVEKIEGPFTPDLAMEEANRIFPDIHSLLFKQFHIGMPVTPYKPEETISSVCKTHNTPVQAALDALNKEFSEKNVSIITCEKLKEKMDSAEKPVLLDIRESWERDISKIEGSHIINAENNEHVLSSFEKDREMVLIDWKQDRSPSFQKWLTQRGYTNVQCLEGGIDLWSEKIDTHNNRYDIDEDDGYRYEDILDEPDDHEGHDHEGHDHDHPDG